MTFLLGPQCAIRITSHIILDSLAPISLRASAPYALQNALPAPKETGTHRPLVLPAHLRRVSATDRVCFLRKQWSYRDES